MWLQMRGGEPHAVAGRMSLWPRCSADDAAGPDAARAITFSSGSPAFRGDKKFDVDGIGVTDGNAGLQPAKLHFPHAPKRIWTGLKKAALVSS